MLFSGRVVARVILFAYFDTLRLVSVFFVTVLRSCMCQSVSLDTLGILSLTNL